MAPHSNDQYDELVLSIAQCLLRESGHSLRHLHHASIADIRQVIQHMLIQRSPPDGHVTTQEEELYTQMDKLLAQEQTRVTKVDAASLPSIADASTDSAGLDSIFQQIVLWKGDITSLRATAIVNAANSALLGCFQPTHRCIDNVIHCKAGPRLRTACDEIMKRQGYEEPVGHAKLTPGFALPSKYVIHTVGPQLRRKQSPTSVHRKQLQSCYTSSLDLLLATVKETDENVTIAFPCISTGLFAFPSDQAVPLAIEAVTKWLTHHHAETRSWKVLFNTFLEKDYELYRWYFESTHPSLTLPPLSPDPVLEAAFKIINDADYLLISAGAGLSAAAGLDYTSEEVMKKYHAPIQKIIPQFRMMYSSIGYTAWSPPLMWGYLFKQISLARFDWVAHRTAPTYSYLKTMRDHFEQKIPNSTFITTSNVDGMFEQENFPAEIVYNMQGDYGRIQCTKPCRQDSVFDVRPFMKKALESFNPLTYDIEDPEGIPKCPNCGGSMFLLLRVDNSFLHTALDKGKKAYTKWLSTVMAKVAEEDKKLVILEIGVGFNTPIVLRIPNERLAQHDGVSLVRVNNDESELPFQSNGVGIGIDANLVLEYLAQKLSSS